MNNYMKRILFASFFMIFICSYAHAQYEDTEGYDENTEIRVKGVVKDVALRMRGAIVLLFKAGNREYRVVTGPQRYLLQEGFEFKTGDSLFVVGSKFIGRDGYSYIVARRIKNTVSGKTLLLRDSSLIPLWRGGPRHMGPGGPHRMGPRMNRDRD
jgi:hypothetical protein